MLAEYDAIAYIKGGEEYPGIYGTVKFRSVPNGTWVDADINGLPAYRRGDENNPQIGPHGFHIHNGVCEGREFSEADGHFNPDAQHHGNHNGDFPVLFSNGGKAKMLFFTDRFRSEDVLGKAVVIHKSPDDFRTDPAGNSGEKIACGEIQAEQ